MKRKIIVIDKDACTGCGLCADACHEGAIGMVVGKAQLLRDDYCDGLGDCLPACPAGAITLEEREAEAYDADAVEVHKAERAAQGKVRVRGGKVGGVGLGQLGPAKQTVAVRVQGADAIFGNGQVAAGQLNGCGFGEAGDHDFLGEIFVCGPLNLPGQPGGFSGSGRAVGANFLHYFAFLSLSS